jgi:hypothetical protein
MPKSAFAFATVLILEFAAHTQSFRPPKRQTTGLHQGLENIALGIVVIVIARAFVAVR